MSRGEYPATRMRRNRMKAFSRRLVAENSVSIDDLIWPLFVIEGTDSTEAVASMPGVNRWSIDHLVKQARLAPSSLINNVYEEAEPGLWRSGYAGDTQDSEDTDRKILSAGYITVTHIWPTYAGTNALAPGSLDWLIRVSAADPDS